MNAQRLLTPLRPYIHHHGIAHTANYTSQTPLLVILFVIDIFHLDGNDNVAMRMSYHRFSLIAKSLKYSLVVKIRKKPDVSMYSLYQGRDLNRTVQTLLALNSIQ